MPKIKYAIFDVGQTIYPFTLKPLHDLMHSLTSDIKSYENGKAVFNYDYDPYMKGELTDKDFAKDLCLFCHVEYTADILPQINKALHLGCGKPFKETLQAISSLQKAGIQIGILSNALPILHDTKINLIKDSYVFTSYELGMLKPEPEIYQRMQERLNVPFEQILFIDDKQRNVLAAQTLGIHGIVYNKETILNNLAAYLPPCLNTKNSTLFFKHQV